jgi:hypothetical protein
LTATATWPLTVDAALPNESCAAFEYVARQRLSVHVHDAVAVKVHDADQVCRFITISDVGASPVD